MMFIKYLSKWVRSDYRNTGILILRSIQKSELVAILIAIVAVIGINGFIFAEGGVLDYLSFYKVMTTSNWLPHDYWASRVEYWNIRTGFIWHIQLLELIFGLKYSFYIIFLVTVTALVLIVRHMSHFFFRALDVQLSPNWVILVMLMPPFSNRFNRAIGGQRIFDDDIIASMVATVPIYLGITYLLKGKYRIAFMLYAYATLLHIQLGGLFLILGSFIYLVEFYKEPKKIFQTYLLITPILFFPVYIIYRHSLILKAAVFDFKEVWEGYLFRLPHHMFPSHFGLGHWENFYLRVILCFVLIFFLFKQFRRIQDKELKYLIYRLSGFVLGIGILIGVGVIAIEYFESLFILKLQVFRLDYATCFLAAISFVVLINKLTTRFFPFFRKVPWAILIILYGLALYTDKFAQQKIFRPWAERFKQLELPGDNPNHWEPFLNQAKEFIPQNSTVALGFIDSPGIGSLNVRLILNSAIFYSQKLTPHMDELWSTYNKRRSLVRSFEKTPNRFFLQAMMDYQPIDFLITEKPLDWMSPILSHNNLYLYSTLPSRGAQSPREK